MVIVGYAVLNGDLLDNSVLAQLRGLGPSSDNKWGAIFVYDRDQDGTRRKFTLLTADAAYAQMLVTGGSRIELSVPMLRERFPGWQTGWVIDETP